MTFTKLLVITNAFRNTKTTNNWLKEDPPTWYWPCYPKPTIKALPERNHQWQK